MAPQALADAEAAVKMGGLTDRLHFHLACLYSQLAAQAEMEAAKKKQAPAGDSVRLQDRGLEHLQNALEFLPPSRRQEFWQEQVSDNPLLASLTRAPRFARLAGRFGPRPPA